MTQGNEAVAPTTENNAQLVTLNSETKTADILKVLESKISSLKHIEDTPWKTQKVLDGFGDISKETKIENLIRAYHSVVSRETGYNEAAIALGLKTYPAFEVSGANAEAWKHDIMLRISIIQYSDTLAQLTTYKEKMSKFLSEADQREMLMQEMTAFLSK